MPFIAGGHRKVDVIDGDETPHRHPYSCASGWPGPPRSEGEFRPIRS